jgi:hypothetical protein
MYMYTRRVANDPLLDLKLVACLPWRLSDEETSILSISGPQMDRCYHTKLCAPLHIINFKMQIVCICSLFFFCALSDVTDRNNKKKNKIASASTNQAEVSS